MNKSKIFGDKKYYADKQALNNWRVKALQVTRRAKENKMDNPITRVDAPKAKKQEAKAYDENDIAALIEALEDEDIQFKTCVHIALAGGLRIGEIMGLEWKDINFDKGSIEIRQAAQYLPGEGIFIKDPKNETSKRVIGLPEPVMDMIAQLQHEQKIRKVKLGNKWNGGNLGIIENDTDKKNTKPNPLFIQADGSPAYPYTPSKQFKKFVEQKGLPPLTFHGLRHSSASYLIAAGEDVVTVSKRLGHAKPGTTLQIYAHQFKKRDALATSKLAGMYQKKEEKTTKPIKN